MASLAQLQADVNNYLNRQDTGPLFPGWVSLVETEIAQTLRARCMVTSAYQNIDRSYIPLPSDFATMESIRDARTGEVLHLHDQWEPREGGWFSAYETSATSIYAQVVPNAPSTGYRLVSNCIEFLPHPVIPDPPDPSWVPQQVLMGWYAKPRPLLLPTDTNPVLEQLYGVYLWGFIKQGALWALDDARAAQADAQWQQQVTRADLHKQQSDFSGAPFTEAMAVRF